MKNKNLLFTVLSILSFQFSFGQFASNSFASQVYFSTGTNIQGITTADLNNDGKKEIITANLNSNTIGIFVNNTVTGIVNNSSFSTYFTCATTLVSGVTPAIVTTADLNGDNKPDIIVGYNNSSYTFFSIFLNQYNGTTFNSSSFTKYDFTAQSGPGGVSVADYDLDGKIDISVANGSSASMSVFRNTSSLSTLSFASALNYSTGTTPGTITSGDIDNDGKIDIAVSNWGSNSITVYRNTSSSVGNISFSLINSVNFFTTQINPNWIKIIDIDNNGLKEVICSNWGSNSISIYSNTSSSGISFNPRVDKSTGSYPQANDAADFDGDGKIDIGLSMAGVTSAGCFKNIHTSGSISASSFSGISYYGVNNSPVGFSATDIDNDLRPDIIVANYSSQNISVLKNKMLANEPTVPSSNVIAIPSTTSVTLNFTKGNGNKRLVVARSSTNAMVSPVDTSFYTANPVFGFGTNIGSSNYIVYGDTGSTVTVTGLSYGQVYNFTIYEYNGIGGFSNYLTSSAVAITQAIGDVYYSKSSGALNLVGTWGPNTDGTGTSPTTFNNPNTVYVVTNNPAPTLTNNWIVSGTNSFIVVGDGINALNFTIPSGTSLFTDSVAVKANATLTFIGGLIGNKAYFDSLSTAQFTSSSPQNIPGFTYYNIVIANSNKTITNNCNVRGALNLLNNINTGTYTLTLGVSGSQPGVLNRNANGTISGRFKRWFAAATNTGSSGLFPMLVGTNYRPAVVEFTVAPTAAGTLTTEFFSIPPGNSGLYLYDFSLGFVEVNKAAVNGYWKIDPIGSSGGVYTLTLTGTGFYGISAVTDLRIIKRQTAGAWTLPSGSTAIAGTGSTSAPVVGRSGYSGFGEFTLGGDSTQNPMPVKWLSFDGILKEEGVLLNWKTVQEINNAYFIVERKTENKTDFESIAKEFPVKNGSIKSYAHLDQNNSKSEIYNYRIKQVDLDGKFSYSKTILIHSNYVSEEMIVGPNPAQDFIEVRNININEPIELIDALGKIISIKLENDKIRLNSIPSGIYLLNATSLNGERKSMRIIKE